MKTHSLTFALLVSAVLAFGQKKTLVIGTMINKPNAILVINPPNSDQGFLLPQLTTSQRQSIGPNSPQDDGLMVFDTSEKSFYHWNSNAWVKGLGSGAASQALNYDPATQRLSLTNAAGSIDLSALKEVPTQTGNNGRFLTTDGTMLSWATLSSMGDITAVIAGQGLTGGASSGDATLNVNTDGTTISVNGSNQVQLANGAVTAPKMSNNAINSNHIIDGTVRTEDILDNTITTNDIANAAITSPNIASGAVGTTNIASGGNNKILSTDAGGAVIWSDLSLLTNDDQDLSLVGNVLNIQNGAGVDMNDLSFAGDVGGTPDATVIQTDAITSTKILDNSILPSDLQSGGNNKVLTTSTTGTVAWADRSTFTDAQNLSLAAGNQLNITNGTGVDLNTITATTGDVQGPLNNLAVQTGAINSAKILDGSVATGDIASGGNDKVLTTNAGGVVNWVDRTTFTDDQNLTFAGNTLSIENGTPVNLTAAGQVTGLLDNLVVQPGAPDQVFVTNGVGSAAFWVTPTGDVTGPVSSSIVAGIQGNPVAPIAPNAGDVLIWNGSAWTPGPSIAAATTQFYAVDPSNFSALEPGSNNSSILGLYEDANSRFVFAKGTARQIMAPLNLPHGATITNMTVYYEYSLLLGPIVINLYRKTYGGGANETLASVTTPLLGLGIVSASATASNGVVDNNAYTYRVHVTFSNLLNANDAASAVQRIYGVKITYTK